MQEAVINRLIDVLRIGRAGLTKRSANSSPHARTSSGFASTSLGSRSRQRSRDLRERAYDPVAAGVEEEAIGIVVGDECYRW